MWYVICDMIHMWYVIWYTCTYLIRSTYYYVLCNMHCTSHVYSVFYNICICHITHYTCVSYFVLHLHLTFYTCVSYFILHIHFIFYTCVSYFILHIHFIFYTCVSYFILHIHFIYVCRTWCRMQHRECICSMWHEIHMCACSTCL